MGRWKFNRGDKVVANEKAPADYRGRQGIVIGHGPDRSEYIANINGQIAYLNSWWLDLVHKVSER